MYDCLDTNNNKTLSIDEFFEVIEVMESHEKFAIPLIKRKKQWKSFRRAIDKKLKLSKIASNFIYNIIVFVIMVVNCALLISAQLVNDNYAIAVFYFIDELFLYVYLFDFILKVLGFGFEAYFSDIWNKFDFTLLLVSFASELIFISNPNISNFSLDVNTSNVSNSFKVLLF